jgi:hypothetical protein
MKVTDRTPIHWLLDSDPSIRWQVMRDLTGASADEVTAERSRVAREGWGAQVLASQDADGRWGGGTFFPRGIGTLDTLHLLYLLGLDPESDAARRAVAPIDEAAAGTTTRTFDSGRARSSPASMVGSSRSARTSARTCAASWSGC